MVPTYRAIVREAFQPRCIYNITKRFAYRAIKRAPASGKTGTRFLPSQGACRPCKNGASRSRFQVPFKRKRERLAISVGLG